MLGRVGMRGVKGVSTVKGIFSPVTGSCLPGVIERSTAAGKEHMTMMMMNNGTAWNKRFSMSACRRDLMEFFDDKKNWGEVSVRVGRAWKIDELRIKSNTDLHKLWFVLLKEKNMLLTMEHEAKATSNFFPNPERIDKVEESMKNLEEVVRERNRAYFLLETGETGERSGEEVENFLGLPEYVQHEEYKVPKEVNKDYLKAKSEEPVVGNEEKQWFLTRLKEKQKRLARRQLQKDQYEVINIMRRFPHVDLEALKEKYPNVDIDRYERRFLRGYHLGNMPSKYLRERPKK